MLPTQKLRIAPMKSGWARTVMGTASVALVLALGVGGQTFAQQVPWTTPVPHANCGANDRVEPGLSGQTSLVDRLSGASMTAYNCNMDFVGNFTGEGAEWQMAWFKDCAYYDTRNNAAQVTKGSVVVDVSDPTNPVASAYLNDPSMAEPWESLKVHERRQLLGAAQANSGGGNQPGFALYDISTDCKHPQLLFAGNIDVTPGGVRGHAGQFSKDGLTYWGAVIGGTIYPLDVTDPTSPKLLAKFLAVPGTGRPSPHDVSTNDDGTRLYVANLGSATGGIARNGLVILDVSDVQNRLPNPQYRIVSELYWNDGRVTQQPTPIRIKGRPYILQSDENSLRAAGCAQGVSAFGMARIIDILDETNPKLVSKLMLDVHDPARCSQFFPAATSTDFISTGGFLYDAHYCTADDPKNAKMVACSYMQAGVRIFDVRNPYLPKEVAYYKPPATGTAFRPGSTLWTPTANLTHDLSSSNIRFLRKDGQVYIWFTSHNNGFFVTKLSENLRALDPDLFKPGTKGATGNTQPY